MIIDIVLEEFKKEMNKILKEKYPKYKDSWKTAGIGVIKPKINEQMKKISEIIMSGIDWDRKR